MLSRGDALSSPSFLLASQPEELEHFDMQVLDGWINVNDVANAHIQAFERPTTSGRYCLVERVAHFSEVVRILCELYNFVIDEKPFVPTYQVSKGKAKSLGVEFIPLDVSLEETVESL
ncbi:hypothetical protein FF1_007040 [Malus domestica]